MHFDVDFQAKAMAFDALPDVVVTATGGGDAEKYTGSYEVTPKVTAQTLPTKDKLMREDVVVREIPITRVSNTSGGNTIISG